MWKDYLSIERGRTVMTKILYNRAVKLFMDKISAGLDEYGAHEIVKKKYGKPLADKILGDAQAEMKAIRGNKRNPRKLSREDREELKVLKKNFELDPNLLTPYGLRELRRLSKENPRRSLVGRHVSHWQKGRGKIIDERPTYVVVRFEDKSQDRFDKDRIKEI